MNKIKTEPIIKEFLVETDQERAFKIFTGKIDSWWPRTHHIGSTPMTELVLEPHANGRWFSRHEDGSEVNIGYVLTWSPYGLLVLIWQVNGNFQHDPDIISEIEVQFIAEGPRKTRVKFEHKNLDRLGVGKAVESMDNGWGVILDLYKNFIIN